MDLLKKFENKKIAQLTEGKKIASFRPGDTVRVKVNIVEGTTERVQAFEGVVMRFHRNSLSTTFTVKKESNGESVERIFQLYSPRIDGVEVIKRGKVRKAKIYYMRKLKGKAARIEERKDATRQNN
jgi:large subunit ribosomal protein L19